MLIAICCCGEQLASRGADHGELGCTWAPIGREIFCPEHLEARDENCAGGVRRSRSAGARGEPADFGPSLTRGAAETQRVFAFRRASGIMQNLRHQPSHAAPDDGAAHHVDAHTWHGRPQSQPRVVRFSQGHCPTLGCTRLDQKFTLLDHGIDLILIGYVCIVVVM